MSHCDKCGGRKRREKGECSACLSAAKTNPFIPSEVYEHMWVRELSKKGPMTKLGLLGLGIPQRVITLLCQRDILERVQNPLTGLYYYRVRTTQK
jgi:hypothetical protein